MVYKYITDTELSAMEVRANAATAGPWEHTNSGESIHGGDGELVASMHAPEYEEDEARNVVNFEFISNARLDIPRLIEEIRWLKGVCRALDLTIKRTYQ